MSSLSRYPTSYPQSESTEELNSEPFWIDSFINSALPQDALHFLEGVTTTLDCPSAFPTDHLPSFEDDPLGPPPATSNDAEPVNLTDFTVNGYNVPFNIQPEDLLALPAYQSAYSQLFCDGQNGFSSTQTTALYETPQMAPPPYNITAIARALSTAHLVAALVDHSAIEACDSYFDRILQAPPTPDSRSGPSPLTSPFVSSCSYDSPESSSNVGCVPRSDDDDYYPTQSTSYQKQKKRLTTKSRSRRAASSPTRSTSSESEKSVASSRASRRSHPYKHDIHFRNFQSEDSALLIGKESDFRCPVAGCDHVQGNRRIPDLKRHIETHSRWRKPEKWICCGVGVDRAHLYGKGIRLGMTDEERIEAGAYEFRGRLMIGGCMKSFARRDALKRHVDNSNIPCAGHMDSYYF